MKTAVQYEIENARETQVLKPAQMKGLSRIYVPCMANNVPGTKTISLDIDADGDYQMNSIGISVNGYWLLAANGSVTPWATFDGGNGDIQTAYPSLIAPAGGPIRPKGGLLVSISEGGSKIGLTDGFVDIATEFTPGFSGSIWKPTEFRRVLARSGKLNFEFRSFDTAQCLSVANVITCVEVSVALNGHRIRAGV